MCIVYLQLKQWIFGLCVLEMKDKFCCLLMVEGDGSLICDVRNLHEKRTRSWYHNR